MRHLRLACIPMLLLMVASCSAQSKTDKFAHCLTEKGVKMYGAFWCPHCKDQKDLFGESFAYVTYVECAIPGKPTNVQTEACSQMQVHKYPTWIFPDGERVELVLSLNELAKKSGCEAPPPPKQ